MLALVTRDLVAAEAYYHRTCYRSYTLKSTHPDSTSLFSEPKDQSTMVENEAFANLFKYIREDLFDRPRVLKLTSLTSMLVTLLKKSGVQNVSESTKKHIRRTLTSEFGDTLHFIPDDNGRILVYPKNLTLSEVLKENI